MGAVLSGETDKVSLQKARRLCQDAGRDWQDAWNTLFFAVRTDLLEALRADDAATEGDTAAPAAAPAPAAPAAAVVVPELSLIHI